MTELMESIRQLLCREPVLIAGTLGLDGKPQLHKAELCFEEGGAFWFVVPKCERFYAELSLSPALTLAAYDREARALLRLKGQAVFNEDGAVIRRCLEASPALQSAWSAQPEMLIAFCLKDLCAELLRDDGIREEAVLGTPENVLVGITMKKDKELRDRLVRLMERREAEPIPEGEAALERQKRYDGTLLYLAETAKALWPRLDIRPAERSALFETYDERERYVGLARKRLGNAHLDKPEDLTHWLSLPEAGD